MRLLATTSRSLLLIDTDSGESIQIDRGYGLYYGIAHSDRHLYVAARNRLTSSDVDPAQERGEILLFDRTLQLCGALQAPFPLRDLHEIAWHDNRLWATCSHDNMIAMFDGEQWEQWFPLGGSMEGPGDVNHFNSFLFEDDRVWILAHNRGDSELLAFSIATRALLERVPLGRYAHNIWREQGQLHTCSSYDGKIVGMQGFSLETGGFPRGIDFDREQRCVGISALAERKARDFTVGKLMLFDHAWVLQKELALPGEGLINHILRLPDGFDDGRQRATLPASRKTLLAPPSDPIAAPALSIDRDTPGGWTLEALTRHLEACADLRVAAVENALAEAEHSLAQENARLIEASHSLQQSNTRLAELGNALQISNSRLIQSESQCLQLNARLAALEQRATGLQEQLSQQEARANHAELQVHAIKSSRSWRITAPLRSLGAKVKQLLPQSATRRE